MIRKYDCLIWTGKKSSDGYGVVRYQRKQFLLHRLIWQGVNGPIAEGKLILHKCDTPSCFNPNHLFIGTYLDNNRDRMNKGRSAIGERSGRWKLTDLQVIEIRRLYNTGEYTTIELGYRFNVSNHQISMIVRNLSRRIN
jgi:hypothetical protein